MNEFVKPEIGQWLKWQGKYFDITCDFTYFQIRESRCVSEVPPHWRLIGKVRHSPLTFDCPYEGWFYDIPWPDDGWERITDPEEEAMLALQFVL